jgi:hypothetical protein
MVGKLGPNALDLSLEEFRALLKGRRGAIKTFFLDQSRIASIRGFIPSYACAFSARAGRYHDSRRRTHERPLSARAA